MKLAVIFFKTVQESPLSRRSKTYRKANFLPRLKW